MSLARRDLNAVAQATRLTNAAFMGQSLVWGRSDCAILTDFHLAGLGVDSRYATYLPYASKAGAVKTLRKAGFKDTVDWLDSLGLQRLPGAAHAMTGDVLGLSLPDAGMTGLAVVTGHNQILGFHSLEGVCCRQVLDLTYPDLIVHAWRA